VNLSEDFIAMPVKVDAKFRIISGPQKAYRWKLDVPASFTGTTRKRLYFRKESEAKAKRLEFLQRKEKVGTDHNSELSRRGLSVEEAVAFALKHAPIISDLTVARLLEQFVAHRQNEVKVSDRYAATLQSYCVRISSALGQQQVHTLNRATIRKFLEELKARDGKSPASVSTRNHYLETLRAVFSFARHEGFMSTSPCDGIHTAKADPTPTSVLTLEEVQSLLEVAASPEHSEVAPALLLQLFAGPRRSEIPHITWDILLGKYLRLDKVKRGTLQRPVEMPDALLAWLAPYRRTEGYVFDPQGVCRDDGGKEAASVSGHARTRKIEDAYAWRLEVIARQSGVKLPKNVLRHTAITMRVNFTGDVAATSRWAGNSPAVVFSNYLGAATPEDAKRFYALRPKQQGEVIQMPPTPKEGESGPDEQVAAV
jgi:site-specific recombinase XerD